MAKQITVHVPAIAETMCTGLIAKFEYEHRNKLYTCEVKNGRSVCLVTCTKAGKPINWEKLPTKLQKQIHITVADLRNAYALATA